MGILKEIGRWGNGNTEGNLGNGKLKEIVN